MTVGDIVEIFSGCKNDSGVDTYRCYFRVISKGGAVHFFGDKENMLRHYDTRIFDDMIVYKWNILFKPDGSRCIIEIYVKEVIDDSRA